MRTTTHPVRRAATGLAGVAALSAVATLAACSSDGTGAATSPARATSTASAPVGPSTASSAASAAPTTPATTTASGASGRPSSTAPTPAGADQVASGLPTCQPSQTSVRVEAQAGGEAAGSTVLTLLVTDTGTTQCVTQGYPGVSLVAPGSGRQLGAAADRVPGAGGSTGPLLRLEPGKTVASTVRISRAANYPTSACRPTTAAGFRVYLPGTTAAAFAPYEVAACAAPSVHLLEVQPLTV